MGAPLRDLSHAVSRGEWGMWGRVHACLGPRPGPMQPELPSPMGAEEELSPDIGETSRLLTEKTTNQQVKKEAHRKTNCALYSAYPTPIAS
eukprot:14125631-Alexandrium_andersonii.AAC.1